MLCTLVFGVDVSRVYDSGFRIVVQMLRAYLPLGFGVQGMRIRVKV